MQKLLCHGNYCELVLSPVRASFKQPSAARPATGPTNSVAHPSIRGEQRRRRTMSAQQIAPNPRQLITRSPPRCRTSIIQSSALVQASFSLSMVALAAQPRRSFPTNFYFGHFPGKFVITHIRWHYIGRISSISWSIYSENGIQLWSKESRKQSPESECRYRAVWGRW